MPTVTHSAPSPSWITLDPHRRFPYAENKTGSCGLRFTAG